MTGRFSKKIFQQGLSIDKARRRASPRLFELSDEDYMNDIPMAQDYAEKRLLWALLERTYKDATMLGERCKPKDCKSARAFLASKAVCPFSFLWVCDQLDLDPVYYTNSVKEGIKKYLKGQPYFL